MPLEIHIAEIPQSGGDSRRCREQAAVAALIAAHIGDDARLEHDASRAPYLPTHPDLAISISHSRTHAAIAIGAADECFGIDIEEAREQLLRTALRFISPADILRTDMPRLQSFLYAWVAKEAVYKALRATALPLEAIRLNIPAGKAQVIVSPDAKLLAVPVTAGSVLNFSLSFRPAPESQLIAIAKLLPT